MFNTSDNNFIKNLNKLLSYTHDIKRNISKSYTKGAMALCVSDNAKIGVDIEQKIKRSLGTMEHFVQKFRTFQIKNIPPQINERWFYTAWTGMESYFKLDGAGFGAAKDFILDIQNQSVWRGSKEIAWMEYFELNNYIFCICSNTKFLKQDVQLNFYGWEGYGEKLSSDFLGSGF